MKKFISLTFLIFYFSQFLSSFVENEDSAPEFKLSDSYGNEISLSSFIGKKVVLEGTNHGCPYVAKHYETGNMQSTQEFAKEEDIIWFSIISSAPGTKDTFHLMKPIGLPLQGRLLQHMFSSIQQAK